MTTVVGIIYNLIILVSAFKFKNGSTNPKKNQKKTEEMIPILVFTRINRNHNLYTEKQYGNMTGSKYKFYRLIEKFDLYNLDVLVYCQDIII